MVNENVISSRAGYGLRLQHSEALVSGMSAGIPIGLGYFAVAFSLGIAARVAGLSALQGFVASLLTVASAGEYAGFTLMAGKAALWEIALMMLVINARYMLMSCALGQRLRPGTGLLSRLVLGGSITDEIFGITIGRSGYVEPVYAFGALLVAAPMWAVGTALGVWMGNMLPARMVSALSVALYGMFLAVIIPAAKKERRIALVVAVSFLCSALASVCPVVRELSEGTRTLILTVGIAAAAALIAPVPEEKAA